MTNLQFFQKHLWLYIDAFEKLTFESQFQELSPGGAVSYVEVPNMENNIPAVLAVLHHIYDNIMYAELNTKSDCCQKCGFTGEIQVVEDDGPGGDAGEPEDEKDKETTTRAPETTTKRPSTPSTRPTTTEPSTRAPETTTAAPETTTAAPETTTSAPETTTANTETTTQSTETTTQEPVTQAPTTEAPAEPVNDEPAEPANEEPVAEQ